MVAHTCSPSYSGGWNKRIAWTWDVEVAVSGNHNTVFQPGWQRETVLNKQTKKETKRGLIDTVPHGWGGFIIRENGKRHALHGGSRERMRTKWKGFFPIKPSYLMRHIHYSKNSLGIAASLSYHVPHTTCGNYGSYNSQWDLGGDTAKPCQALLELCVWERNYNKINTFFFCLHSVFAKPEQWSWHYCLKIYNV